MPVVWGVPKRRTQRPRFLAARHVAHATSGHEGQGHVHERQGRGHDGHGPCFRAGLHEGGCGEARGETRGEVCGQDGLVRLCQPQRSWPWSPAPLMYLKYGFVYNLRTSIHTHTHTHTYTFTLMPFNCTICSCVGAPLSAGRCDPGWQPGRHGRQSRRNGQRGEHT